MRKERKTKIIRVHLTETQYHEVKAAASQKKMSLSKYVKQHFIP
jgi:hypothetical protein